MSTIFDNDWFKRSADYTRANIETKLGWDSELTGKYSSYLYDNMKAKILRNSKPQLAVELKHLAEAMGVNSSVGVVIDSRHDTSMTDGKKIIISNKFEQPTGDDFDTIDLIIGLLCHEASHCLYTDFNCLLRENKKNGINQVVHWLHNVIEDEIIETKLGIEHPGYINFITQMKYYYFDTCVKDIIGKDCVNDLDYIMKLFLYVIRYPKYIKTVDKKILNKYDDLFNQIHDVLWDNGCLDPKYNQLTTRLSLTAAQQIYEIIKKFIDDNATNKKNKASESGNGKGEGEPSDGVGENPSDGSKNPGESGEDNDDGKNGSNEDDSDDDSNNDTEDNTQSDTDSDATDNEEDDMNNGTEDNTQSDDNSGASDDEEDDEINNDASDENDDASGDENDEETGSKSAVEQEKEIFDDKDSIINRTAELTAKCSASSETNKPHTYEKILNNVEEIANHDAQTCKNAHGQGINTVGTSKANQSDFVAYNRMLNEIRPYINVAKNLIIENSYKDILTTNRFRRNGTLDTRKLADAMMGINTVYQQKNMIRENKGGSRFALVIMLDESGSMMWNDLFYKTGQIGALIYEALREYDGIELYVYGHGEVVVPYINKRVNNRTSLATRNQQYDQNEEISYPMIIEDVKKQTNLPIVAINITDSAYCADLDNMKTIINDYKKKKVSFNCICLMDDPWNKELNDNIYGEDNWVTISEINKSIEPVIKHLAKIIKKNYDKNK